MSIPTTGKYAENIYPAVPSDIVGASPIVDGGNFNAEWWGDNNTSDGTRLRVSFGGVEVASDPFLFDDVAEELLFRFNAGTILAASSDAARTIRSFTPNTRNTAYAASDTYGQYNAYDSNIYLYYPLNDLQDRTITAGDLTGYNNPTFNPGKLGDGMSLNGTNQGATIPAGAWGISTGHSFYAWVNPDTGSGSREILAADNSADRTFLFRLVDGVLSFISWASDGDLDINISGSTDLRSLGWVFVWCDFDTTNGAEIGYNSTSEATSSETSNRRDNATYIRSVGMETRGSYGEFYDGQIESIIINNTKRTDDWKTEEYDQTNDNATFWGTWTTGTLGGGGTAYTIEAETGSIAATGHATDLTVSKKINTVLGNIIASGKSAIQKIARNLSSDTGNIIADGKTIDLTGGYNLPAETGNILQTGHSITLQKATIIIADTGNIIVTGYDANLGNQKNYVLSAETCSIAVDGKDINLLRESGIVADPGNIVVTGYEVNLVYSGDNRVYYKVLVTDGDLITEFATLGDLCTELDLPADMTTILRTKGDIA